MLHLAGYMVEFVSNHYMFRRQGAAIVRESSRTKEFKFLISNFIRICECCILSLGWFPIIWILCADVSEHSVSKCQHIKLQTPENPPPQKQERIQHRYRSPARWTGYCVAVNGMVKIRGPAKNLMIFNTLRSRGHLNCLNARSRGF
jgi:hypothetical protein